MSISEIIQDEANQKRHERRKKAGVILDFPPQPQTMSMNDVRRILGGDRFQLTVNNHYPQIVDIEEF